MRTSRVDLHRLWVGATVALLASAVVVLGAPAAEPEPPNIVVVMYDDAAAYDVAQMPKIKASVADAGMEFTRFYATESLCCPSRASVLTGEYVHNHRVDGNHGREGGWARFYRRGHEQRTIAVALQELGYRTGYFGKYLNGYGDKLPNHVPVGWDRWFGSFGFANWHQYSINDDGAVVGPPSGEETYYDSLLANRALDWTRDSIASGAPTFTFVSFHSPKPPYVDPPGHPGAFPDAAFPDKPSFNEANVGDKPAHIRKLGRLSGPERKAIKKRSRGRLRVMLKPDDFVGDLVEALGSSGALQNTFVVVLSDNGFMKGEHRIRGGKLVPYEESVRLPLYIRGPGVPEGSTTDALTSTIDLFGTFVDIGGGGNLRDGRSLLPLLTSAEVAWRDAVLIENLDSDEAKSPEYFGIVTDQRKLVAYETGERELYNLANDPFELESRHKRPRAHRSALATQLGALRRCAGSTCRDADHAASP